MLSLVVPLIPNQTSCVAIWRHILYIWQSHLQILWWWSVDRVRLDQYHTGRRRNRLGAPAECNWPRCNCYQIPLRQVSAVVRALPTSGTARTNFTITQWLNGESFGGVHCESSCDLARYLHGYPALRPSKDLVVQPGGRCIGMPQIWFANKRLQEYQFNPRGHHQSYQHLSWAATGPVAEVRTFASHSICIAPCTLFSAGCQLYSSDKERRVIWERFWLTLHLR